jgi:ABC-2 type transport system ATP-binding protein
MTGRGKYTSCMIELKAATKRYGSLTAVDNVSFSVKAGEYFALLGPNGAGKTTIVKMLLGFTRPESGSLSINGLSSTLAASHSAVGYLAENCHIPPYLSGWQYLHRCTELLDISRSDAMDQCRRIVELIGMQGREYTKAKTYSKGMIQRFGLGAALIGNPKLLILDEPTAGLDPIGIREIRQLLESLKDQGLTIFLNSHLLSEVEKICDNAAIINRGRLLVKDAISALVKDSDTLEDVFVRLVKG